MLNHKIVSKYKTSYIYLYFTGIALFSFLSYTFSSKYNPNDFKTYMNFGVGIVFGLIACLITVYIFSIPKIIIYANRIEVNSFFGWSKRLFFLSEINGWTIRKFRDKYSDYEILYLDINQFDRLKIRSYNYTNFHQLQSEIIKTKPKDIKLKKILEEKENTKIAITFILLGLIFLYTASQFYLEKNLTKDDVWTIKGKLSEEIKLEHNRRSKSLVLKLENLNEFKFSIGSLALKETFYDDLMNNFQKGDEIHITIEKNEYEKKIKKSAQMTFFDKCFHYEKIDIVEIDNNNFKYLALSDYNKTHNDNNILSVAFFGTLGLLFLGISIFIYKKDKIKKHF